MARGKEKRAPDQAIRDAILAERRRNVLVDAGAGTGKTTILVGRLVELLAPTEGGRGIPISRIAAITFTRKAAGELRLKIREKLLEELARSAPNSERGGQLRDALAGLDTAHVGTIHGFADRLLRLRPVEAQLSPSYEIVEDDSPLVRETFEVLLEAMEGGTLAGELAGTGASTLAEEATRTILDALECGLQAESRESEWHVAGGLDALVEGFIRERDVPPPVGTPVGFDKAAFRKAAAEFLKLAAPVTRGSPGKDWIASTARLLRELRDCSDPGALLSRLGRQMNRAPSNNVTKRDTFSGDEDAWRVWNAFKGKDKGRATALRDDLLGPLHRWMASRLVRLFPVVVALYERVKARHRQLDQLDPLVKLRDLLARDRAARANFQLMFDHVFVDEFQDTDPLQAEIVLFLCEKEALAAGWSEVVLADGKLTLVGDPKQSIYRFRRADVAVYDRVREIVARRDHLEGRLSANFRTVPPLVEWFNDRFERILGTSDEGKPFDRATGRVFHQPLVPGREGGKQPPVQVMALDFGGDGKHDAEGYRSLEARALARYLRWLVEASDLEIADPLDGRLRRVRYGDVAVLAISTRQLPVLFPVLDAEGIPYASRGGKLFLDDPLHRQFVLGLRALADRDDGVAEAALLRPPFFSVDLADLACERGAKPGGADEDDERVLRARQARECVRKLRRHRFARSPGITARDLFDRTAFARAVALGPNGAQRLVRLRELCLVLESLAADEGLDFDGATARMREWVDKPPQLDPPYPVGEEAVEVMSIHQAKGLEFPVVAIWDGRAQWRSRSGSGAWRMERDGRGWMMSLQGLKWEEPAGLGIVQREQAYLAAERERLVYVAATRARDLLIVPRAGQVAAGRYVCGDLAVGAQDRLVRTMETYLDGEEPPAWATAVGPPSRPEQGDGAALEKTVTERWEKASREAARPRFRPVGVSGAAPSSATLETEDDLEILSAKAREGRFGSVFGSVVHRAIGLALRDSNLPVLEAVLRTAARAGMTEHIDEAVADVGRALDALRAEGLACPPGPDLQIEYPIAGPWVGGLLVSGNIDLVAVTGDRVDVVDFKTDAPPEGPVLGTHPEYVAQVRAYGRLIEAGGLLRGRRLRCGLLFTAGGGIRWVDS